jgi:Fructosamine kinase
MREKAGQIPENNLTLVSSIINKVTGYQTDSIEHIKGIGMNNAVTIANTSHGRFVVRTNVESHLFRFQKEAWCFKQLELTPVLIPTVIGCGVLNGHSYSVAPFIVDSHPISNQIDQIKVWRILGSYARHLNQIQAPKNESEANTYFLTSWEQQVTEDLDLIFKDNLWLDSGLMSQDQQDLVRSYLLKCKTVEAPRGVCQFDLSIANAVN